MPDRKKTTRLLGFRTKGGDLVCPADVLDVSKTYAFHVGAEDGSFTPKDDDLRKINELLKELGLQAGATKAKTDEGMPLYSKKGIVICRVVEGKVPTPPFPKAVVPPKPKPEPKRVEVPRPTPKPEPPKPEPKFEPDPSTLEDLVDSYSKPDLDPVVATDPTPKSFLSLDNDPTPLPDPVPTSSIEAPTATDNVTVTTEKAEPPKKKRGRPKKASKASPKKPGKKASRKKKASKSAK